MTTASKIRSRIPRIAALALTAALAGAIAPAAAGIVPLPVAAPAYAAGGDVCDLCSTNFDITACEALGGWPYDSTRDPVPPAVLAASNPQPQAPAPQAPAPQAPAPQAPAPAAPVAPASPGGSAGGTAGGSSGTASNGGGATTQNQQPATVTAGVPAAPGALSHTISGRKLTFTWAPAADGGSPLTGYKLVLNDGTPIAIPADANTYEITLGAGTYEAALIASNALGDSEPTATLSGIEIDAQTASPTPTPSASDAVLASDRSDAAPSPLVGIFTLGGLVVVAGALVAWWWLRRRAAASVTLE